MLLSPMGEAFSAYPIRATDETNRETMKTEKSSRQYGERSRMIRPVQKDEESEYAPAPSEKRSKRFIRLRKPK